MIEKWKYINLSIKLTGNLFKRSTNGVMQSFSIHECSIIFHRKF